MITLEKLSKEAYLDLVPKAEAVGYALLLDAQLSLIRYNEKRGTVRHVSFYQYNDVPDYRKITKILREKASKLREKWAPQFMTFTPMLTRLKLRMDILEFWVLISDEHDTEIARCYYNRDDLQDMIDLISASFAELDLSIPEEDEKADRDGEKKAKTDEDGEAEDDDGKKAESPKDKKSKGKTEEDHFADLAEHFNMGPKELGSVMRKHGLSLTALEELAEKQKKAEEKEEAENALS